MQRGKNSRIIPNRHTPQWMLVPARHTVRQVRLRRNMIRFCRRRARSACARYAPILVTICVAPDALQRGGNDTRTDVASMLNINVDRRQWTVTAIEFDHLTGIRVPNFGPLFC